MRRVAWTLGSIGVTLLLVLGWQLVADFRLVSPVFLPGPDRAWAALINGMQSGEMLDDLLATLRHMAIGWVLASVAGVALGALIGLSPAARAWLGPTLEFIRPLPASAIIPVGIAFFGLSDGMVLGVIAFGTVWPMLLATVHGFAAVEPRLVEVARALRLGWWQVVWKIALPSALPDIYAGMRLGLTIALVLSVVGEMLAGQEGLGLRILLAARAFRSPELFAGVILLGVSGLVTVQLLDLVGGHLLRWQQR